MNGFGRKQCARWILAALIACMLLAGMGSALAVGLVEMDSALYDEFEEAYAGFVPMEDASFGTGPRDGESWSIGDLLGSRGGEYLYVANCNEWVSLREEASTSSPRIRKLYLGEQVCVLGTWYDWALAYDFTYGHYGWVLLDYLSANDPGEAYAIDGFDYDLEPDGEYWYTSTELLDFVSQPISPAVAYLGLSYEGLVPVGGDDAMCDSYVGGSLRLVGDDQWGVCNIELTGSQGGYTLAGASVGMDARAAFDAMCNYMLDNGAIFPDYECTFYEDSNYIDVYFTMYDNLPGGISAQISNDRVVSIDLYVL